MPSRIIEKWSELSCRPYLIQNLNRELEAKIEGIGC